MFKNAEMLSNALTSRLFLSSKKTLSYGYWTFFINVISDTCYGWSPWANCSKVNAKKHLWWCWHLFRYWLCAVREQANTSPNLDLDLCCHMVSLNENVWSVSCWNIDICCVYSVAYTWMHYTYLWHKESHNKNVCHKWWFFVSRPIPSRPCICPKTVPI